MHREQVHASNAMTGIVVVLVAGSVVFAGPAQQTKPFPALIDSATMSAADGVIVNGINPNNHTGYSVSGTGDVNADGIADLIIGAPRDTPYPAKYRGEAFVVFGRPEGVPSGSINLSTLTGPDGFAIFAAFSADDCGAAACSPGDINGDGVDDIVIGAPLGSPPGVANAGMVYVIFGGAGVGASGQISLATLDGEAGFAIRGVGHHAYAGYSLSGGDFNGDGVSDVVIGAPGTNVDGKNGTGAAYVVFGRPGIGANGFVDLGALDGSDGFGLQGIDAGSRAGTAVSGEGDVNGDGFADLLIGAPFPFAGTNPPAGKVFVVFGGPDAGGPGTVSLGTLDLSDGFVINGADAGDRSGCSVSTSGDVNADGVADIVIGASHAPPNETVARGKCYVVFGGVGVGATGAVDLSSVNGSNGYVVNGVEAEDQAGSAVCSGADVDGDGVNDIIVGAPTVARGAQVRRGETYVVFGDVHAGASGHIDLSGLDGDTGLTIRGPNIEDCCGFSVSSGDFNGDGRDDVVTGAYFAAVGVEFGAGKSIVLYGRRVRHPTFCPADIDGDAAVGVRDFNIVAGQFGTSVDPWTGGDVTGDGAVDVRDFAVVAREFGCAE